MAGSRSSNEPTAALLQVLEQLRLKGYHIKGTIFRGLLIGILIWNMANPTKHVGAHVHWMMKATRRNQKGRLMSPPL